MEIGIADAKDCKLNFNQMSTKCYGWGRAQPPIDCKLNFNQMSTKCYGWGAISTVN